MKIGNILIENPVSLAPMAGVADRAMRELSILCGAGYAVGELTSSKGITLKDNKSLDLIRGTLTERISVPQIFGADPYVLAEAAKICEDMGADIVDINMGCPAPKVMSGGGGSALMGDPERVKRITAAVTKAVNIPVTVKMRTGISEMNKNAVEIAKICEENGIKAITVHGRTREQMYAPPVDYKTVAEVKKAVKIPVIANGDITSGSKAYEALKLTGADGIAIGRAAMGNPFIFSEINAYLSGKEFKITLAQRLDMLKKQIKLMEEYKSPKTVYLEARKHAAWYMRGLKNAAELRRLCSEINCYNDVLRIIEKALEENKNVC